MNQHSFDEKRQTKETSAQNELYEMARGATAVAEISQYAVVANVEGRTTWFVWLLVACSTISGLLFGMDHAPHFVMVYGLLDSV